MRDLPADLAAHLARETTTLCRCWRLIRADGLVLGFTDHDRDIAFGGTEFRAATGLDAADASAELGFAIGGGEVSGALASAGLTEDDLAGGRYDDASVETWLVDWAQPETRMLLDIGTIGEVRRSSSAFIAEVRGLAAALDAEKGRLYRAACDADLGDARCGVALIPVAGMVMTSDGRLGLTASGLETYPSGWFTAGRLVWTGGANAGLSVEVKTHRLSDSLAAFSLWQPAALPISEGDTFQVTPGCDKTFATCKTKFANGLNFRGFPHMPGNDVVMRIARPGEPGLDGGSLVG